jgi:hypothetical protein
MASEKNDIARMDLLHPLPVNQYDIPWPHGRKHAEPGNSQTQAAEQA